MPLPTTVQYFKWNIALPVIKKLADLILLGTHYNQTTYKMAIWQCLLMSYLDAWYFSVYEKETPVLQWHCIIQNIISDAFL